MFIGYTHEDEPYDDAYFLMERDPANDKNHPAHWLLVDRGLKHLRQEYPDAEIIVGLRLRATFAQLRSR
jgi:hypothetical protein